LTQETRLRLIKEIEDVTSGKLLVYITGDRRGLETKIASDVFPFAQAHLMRMGKQKRIDLFLYSTGGLTMAGFGLVNLIREFCDSFGVIVPFKAHSAATLIALGADEIVMTSMGQLSPIDPSVTTPFGPQIQIPGQVGVAQSLPVNVEDVTSYLELAKKTMPDDKAAAGRAFDRLAQVVNPLALGTVNRVKEQISFLAKTLLGYHMTGEARISNIVNTMTKARFSHDYLIGRREAKNTLKLNILENKPLEEKALELYSEYDQMLELSTPYNAETVLGDKESATASFNRAIIESHGLAHVFRTTKNIERVTLAPPQVPVVTLAAIERVVEERWFEDTNI